LFLVSGSFNLVLRQRLRHHLVLDVHCRLGKTVEHLVGEAGKRQRRPPLAVPASLGQR
jgi:hypothetical protein